MSDKHDVIVRKIQEAAQSEYGVSAVKIELEADFNREESEGNCYDCDSTGEYSCGYCEDGTVLNEAARDEAGNEVSEYEDCEECDGSGYVTCGECDGNARGNGDWDDATCYDYLMRQLQPLGLAEKREESRHIYFSHHGATTSYHTYWYPIGALKYAAFYNDGSVDSEFTFTLMLDDPENAFLLPKIVEAFNNLGEDIGAGVSTARAGMHMAFLHDKEGLYPSDPPEEHTVRFQNYRKSMTLLLPTLYFLGSDSPESRSLAYRQPRICDRNSTRQPNENYSGFYWTPKYSAIFYTGGALEFRVFNPCYKTPENILDNLVVMANTLKYWSTEYRPSGLAKVTKEVQFGNDDDDTLSRFFRTEEHIDLLNEGLRRLKPSYYTITEIKQQRNFVVNKRLIKGAEKRARQEAITTYRSYKARQEWEAKVWENRIRTEMMERYMYNTDNLADISEEESERKIAEMVQGYFDLHTNRHEVMPLEAYVDEQVKKLNKRNPGLFVLRDETPEPAPPVPPMPASIHEMIDSAARQGFVHTEWSRI